MSKYLWAAAAGMVIGAGCASSNSSGESKGPGVNRKVTVRNGSTESIQMHAYSDSTLKLTNEYDAVLKPAQEYPMEFVMVPEKLLPWAEFQVAGGSGKKAWCKFEGGEQAARYTDGLYVAGTEPALYELTVGPDGMVQAVRR